MKLHANAALSLKGRRELCRRVVESDQAVTEAAEAAGVSVRCARTWVGRYRHQVDDAARTAGSATCTFCRQLWAWRDPELICVIDEIQLAGAESGSVRNDQALVVSGQAHDKWLEIWQAPAI
jgi:hypothetical protein